MPPAPGTVASAAVPPRHPDWLHHHLAVSGPAGALAGFAARAGGTGTVPWQIDFAAAAEDWFHRLAIAPAPGRLGLAGARILAGQLRDAAERRHGLAIAATGRACPFDLHALVPVPADVLALGPDHPDSLAWLWAHWGTLQALRHVRRERPTPDGAFRVSFWSADWSPWQALVRLRADWPALRFDLRPKYGS